MCNVKVKDTKFTVKKVLYLSISRILINVLQFQRCSQINLGHDRDTANTSTRKPTLQQTNLNGHVTWALFQRNTLKCSQMPVFSTTENTIYLMQSHLIKCNVKNYF